MRPALRGKIPDAEIERVVEFVPGSDCGSTCRRA
jgi:hypothetical protein